MAQERARWAKSTKSGRLADVPDVTEKFPHRVTPE
jgi:hypothetical protein